MIQKLRLFLFIAGLSGSSITALAAPDSSGKNDGDLRALEGRWNTALLHSFGVADTFDFFGERVSVLTNFTWVRCEDGAYAGGAHPTYRGGSAEVYQIAEKILTFVNADRRGSEPEVSLSDLDVSCELKN